MTALLLPPASHSGAPPVLTEFIREQSTETAMTMPTARTIATTALATLMLPLLLAACGSRAENRNQARLLDQS